MKLEGNKDRTLLSKEIPVTELMPWHHFWHETYHRCIVYSVEKTEGGHFSVRFKRVNTGDFHEVVYPRDTVMIKVWNIKMNNSPRYGKTRYRR